MSVFGHHEHAKMPPYGATANYLHNNLYTLNINTYK